MKTFPQPPRALISQLSRRAVLASPDIVASPSPCCPLRSFGSRDGPLRRTQSAPSIPSLAQSVHRHKNYSTVTATASATASFDDLIPASFNNCSNSSNNGFIDPYNCGFRSPRPQLSPKLPFHFETGVGLFAKRPPRPFPPPFLSPPSGSFSDALSTHNACRDGRRGGRSRVHGELIGGCTNGDDAVFASEYFIAANDGVGAWSVRPRGHAGLWSRLIAHFWANAVYEATVASQVQVGIGNNHNNTTNNNNNNNNNASPQLDPIQYLQQAYEQTLEATQAPNDWQGTTTATGAFLSWTRDESENRGDEESENNLSPLLYVTNLGDSQVMVIRPAERSIVFKTKEQWHWFDCPRQLGTNSPDTPRDNAVVDKVPIQVGDVVLAMSDGVIDNLWEHEIVEQVSKSVAEWHARDKTAEEVSLGMMNFVAEELMEAARVIAVDPFAESPFMEHAIEEGLPGEGGKMDDISVVAAICKRTEPDGGF